MTEEHWFDRLHRTLAGDVARRGILRSAGAIAAGLVLGGARASDTIGKGKKSRGKGKNGKKRGNGGRGRRGKGRGNGGKSKPQPQPPPTGQDDCEYFWPGENQQEDRDWCRRTRDETCPQTNLEFCIVEGDPNDPAQVAVCCKQDESCCVDIEGRGECVKLLWNDHHCRYCGRACQFGDVCSEGECVSRCGPGGTYCNRSLIGCCQAGWDCTPEGCLPHNDPLCPEGFGVCYREGNPCADLANDDNHCGRCNRLCSASEKCVNRQCVPLAEGEGHDCPSPHPGAQPLRVPPGWPCCDNNLGYCRENYACQSDGSCRHQ